MARRAVAAQGRGEAVQLADGHRGGGQGERVRARRGRHDVHGDAAESVDVQYGGCRVIALAHRSRGDVGRRARVLDRFGSDPGGDRWCTWTSCPSGRTGTSRSCPRSATRRTRSRSPPPSAPARAACCSRWRCGAGRSSSCAPSRGSRSRSWPAATSRSPPTAGPPSSRIRCARRTGSRRSRSTSTSCRTTGGRRSSSRRACAGAGWTPTRSAPTRPCAQSCSSSWR